MRRDLLHVVLAVLAAGCASNSGGLSFRDGEGRVVGRGELELPGEWPAGQSQQREWRLTWVSSSFPKISARSGRYEGTERQGEVSINLNPGVADNNLVLVGAVKDGVLRGKWYHATFAGAKELGTFDMRTK